MTKENLYKTINIPLPSQPLMLCPKDCYQTICDKLDDFFDDIISGYPDETQNLLRDMYYNNTNVVFDGHTIEGGSFANWHLTGSCDDLVYSMTVDSRCYDADIFFKWNKIHEIAVHIGQAHQRIQQVGVEDFLKEVENQDFNRFTELSVAPVEKILLDALPENIIKQELSYYHGPVRDILENDLVNRRRMGRDDYMRLQHRHGACTLTASITESDIALLHSRIDIQHFKANSNILPLPESIVLHSLTENPRKRHKQLF